MSPITGFAAIAASLGITALSIWGGSYRHIETPDGDIFGYPPPFYWLFSGFSFFLAVGVIALAVLPTKYGLGELEIVAVPVLIACMLGAIYMKKAKIIITQEEVIFLGFVLVTKVGLNEINEIVKYGGIAGSYRRENKACIYTVKNKKFVISGLMTDFDVLVNQLRIMSRNAKYVEKK